MDDTKGLWSEWQSLLANFRGTFTLGGWARFAQWATGTVLCSEEHTITQILTGLDLEAQWRNVERFAEYGAWDREAVERQLMRLVEREHPARWGRYHPVAIDDTKEHRTSKDVWGTCTFHESGAESQPRHDGSRAQLGRYGRSRARQAVDLHAHGIAAVFSQDSIARRRTVSHQNGNGGGDAPRNRLGIVGPHFGRI